MAAPAHTCCLYCDTIKDYDYVISPNKIKYHTTILFNLNVKFKYLPTSLAKDDINPSAPLVILMPSLIFPY